MHCHGNGIRSQEIASDNVEFVVYTNQHLSDVHHVCKTEILFTLFQKFSLLPQQRGNVYLIHLNTQTATRMDAQTNDNVNTML